MCVCRVLSYLYRNLLSRLLCWSDELLDVTDGVPVIQGGWATLVTQSDHSNVDHSILRWLSDFYWIHDIYEPGGTFSAWVIGREEYPCWLEDCSQAFPFRASVSFLPKMLDMVEKKFLLEWAKGWYPWKKRRQHSSWIAFAILKTRKHKPIFNNNKNTKAAIISKFYFALFFFNFYHWLNNF